MFQREIRDFSTVPRWTTLRTIRTQNIGEHSFFVMIYCKQIVLFLGMNEIMLEVLLYAMYHDAEECFSGDTPGPWKRISEDATKASQAARKLMKRRFPDADVGPASKLVKWIVKLANLVDEIAFLGNEYQMGNRNTEGVMRNTMDRVDSHLKQAPREITTQQVDHLDKAVRDAQQAHMYSLSDYLTG
jgi:5'-deoxynucleotidase YfbR-like HD superfamily hydrolase